MVSPVWLQIKRKSSGTFYMAGTHDIDHEWVREVRKRGKKSQVKSMLHCFPIPVPLQAKLSL